MMWMDVDAALSKVPVNICALTDDTDFKTREESVTYDQAGMDLVWNFTTTAGVTTQTAVTPTTAGDYDWTNQGNGMYTIEMTATGGASINNDTEGHGWFTGFATGVLPWTGPVIGFRAAALNNALIDGGDNLDVNAIQISGDATAADNLELQYDGTGLTGDTFPATQAAVSNIVATGAAVATPAKPAPNGFVITSGENEANDEDSTHALDGVTHDIEAVLDGTQKIEVYYEFDIGSDGITTGVQAHHYLDKGGGAAKNLTVWAYNWGATSWDQIGTLNSGTSLQTNPYALYTSHVGTGANIGLVRIRYLTGSVALSATTKLLVDRIFVEYAIAPTGIVNGSTVTLGAATTNSNLIGHNWVLDLGIQNIDNSLIQGASVSGVGTSANSVKFVDCKFGTASIQKAECQECGFTDTVTMTLVGDYEYVRCQSNVAGAGSPVFTKTAGQAITAEWRKWAGSITASGIEAGDVFTIGGTLGTVTLNGADGTVEIRGTYKAIVDNRTGTPTLNTDGAIKGVDVATTLVDIATAQADLDTITGTGGVVIAPAQGPVVFTGVSNEAGVTLVGAGTGPGLSSTGGATGHGMAAVGGATSGDGVNAAATTDGNGMDLVAVGGNAGLRLAGGLTGPGLHAHGGATGATPGVEFHAHSTSGDAFELEVDGSGDGNADLASIIARPTTAITESYAAKGVAPTPDQVMMQLVQNINNRKIVSTVETHYKIDGLTEQSTYTLDSATKPTKRDRAT